jgi:hypothetical protein
MSSVGAGRPPTDGSKMSALPRPEPTTAAAGATGVAVVATAVARVATEVAVAEAATVATSRRGGPAVNGREMQKFLVVALSLFPRISCYQFHPNLFGCCNIE